MITLTEAQHIIVQSIELMPIEEVDLLSSLGRSLAVDVASDTDMPPFRKAAVDGFACRRADIGFPLKIIATIAAGDHHEYHLPTLSCYKIMTGARVPAACDCIFMVEQSRIDEAGSALFTGNTTGMNVCEIGEDCLKDEILLRKNTLIEPQHIAILASTGQARVSVYRQPRVSLIVTGNELVEPGTPTTATTIRNSNGWQLMAQVKRAGALPLYHGIVADDPEQLKNTIRNACDKSEIVLITGGVSMGDFDYIPDVLAQLGANILFREIAVQPGKPTLFAHMGQTAIFGLPGNPVSTLVQFNLLVYKYIQTMMGLEGHDRTALLTMGIAHSRKKSERQSFFPVTISEGRVFPVRYNGSAHIRSFAEAAGIASFARGVLVLGKGDPIKVHFL